MSRPDPGSEEADEGGQDAGAVLLDEREDVWVRGGVQDEGEKIALLSGESSLDSGEECVLVERERLQCCRVRAREGARAEPAPCASTDRLPSIQPSSTGI